MTIHYLLPNSYKKIGWLLLAPSAILGLTVVITDYNPEFLNFSVPALFGDPIMGERVVFSWIENNILNEILGVLVIIGGILVAFSKEICEDEYISKIRLESLVWSVYVNYAILIFSLLLIYDLSFLWVMIFNMFTVLIFFIARFNWQISKLNKVKNEE